MTAGRPKIGRPLSVTLTDEQRAWVTAESLRRDITVTAVIRAAVEVARNQEGKPDAETSPQRHAKKAKRKVK